MEYVSMKISTILIEADQSQQITGAYTSQWDQDTRKAKGYCAIGKIACATDSISMYGHLPSEQWLFTKLKIPKKFKEMKINCTICEENLRDLGSDDIYIWEGVLPSYIVHLNDDHGQTFLEIGKYLESIGL